MTTLARDTFEVLVGQDPDLADLEIEPHNHEHLSDLGCSLVEAGQYDEARRVLLDAVAASPPDYETARANLEYLDSLRSG